MQQGQRASAAGSRWPGSEGDSGKSLVVPAQQCGCHGRWPAMPPADDRAGRCPIPLTPLPQKPLWSPGKSSEDHVLKENAVLFWQRKQGRSQLCVYLLCLGAISAGHSHGPSVTTCQLSVRHGEGPTLCHHANGTAQGLQLFLRQTDLGMTAEAQGVLGNS